MTFRAGENSLLFLFNLNIVCCHISGTLCLFATQTRPNILDSGSTKSFGARFMLGDVLNHNHSPFASNFTIFTCYLIDIVYYQLSTSMCKLKVSVYQL